MKRSLMIAYLAMALLAFAGTGFSAETPAAAKEKVLQVTGPVSSIDLKGGSLTVKSKKKGEVACSITSNTKITEGTEAKSLSDIKVNDKVTAKYVESESGKTARSIEIKTAKKK